MTIHLTADIDLAEHYWSPIGSGPLDRCYCDINGHGHSIKNMHIDLNNVTTRWVGLFGYVHHFTAKDLTMSSNCRIDGVLNFDDDGGTQGVGMLIGYSDRGGEMVNCVNQGEISFSNARRVGGLIGYSSESVQLTHCENYGDISDLSGDNSKCTIGGLIGIVGMWFEVTECRNYGNITGAAVSGGIAGEVETIECSACVNYADVYSVGGDWQGGIVGWVSTGRFRNCANHGAISSRYTASGIVAQLGSVYDECISQCVNNGPITAKGFIDLERQNITLGYASGIAAKTYDEGSTNGARAVYSCLNTGKITVTDEGYATGISAQCSVDNSLNTGEVTGSLAAGINCGQFAFNCGNEGVVKGISNYYLVGVYRGGVNVSGVGARYCYNSYNHATIELAGKGQYAHVGGITSHYAVNCYNTGDFMFETSGFKDLTYPDIQVVYAGAISSGGGYTGLDIKNWSQSCYYTDRIYGATPGTPQSNCRFDESKMKTEEFLRLLNTGCPEFSYLQITVRGNEWNADPETLLPLPFGARPGLGVEDVVADAGECTGVVETARYDLSGRRLDHAVPGVNIVVYSDGTRRKILVR
ncbi:MAG: hypothetical protein NC405_06225 [Odoribacter sp.]|nr:hypothetical protein [Odoribacter sp.]